MDAKDITFHNQAASPFFRLPPEIRNHIYTLVFRSDIVSVYPHPHRVTFCIRKHPDMEDTNEPHPEHSENELQEPYVFQYTCRQIFHEAGDLYFALNTFELREKRPHKFSESHLALPCLARIRNARISVTTCTAYMPDGNLRLGGVQARKVRLLGMLKGLTKVMVTIWSCHPSGYTKEEKFAEVKRVFETERRGQAVKFVLE
ncbi:hypothetical protein BU25DRAFT_425487 [Macroventuria anomochaeta]|uniref:Uncharacterized protein n=1 Tax=Macroventuria anomochaeta TaxID=301207 RepID=A0ACB6RNA1_9PLEO|nr:uncharacterized protein BU25DRAFT_425487 [Macroventuria anomochaeta]KAF2622782.1 hypothetical protein BU25DRAFT_425487 [Macroventuria anomochaeta]